jgi:hypothetical protein
MMVFVIGTETKTGTAIPSYHISHILNGFRVAADVIRSAGLMTPERAANLLAGIVGPTTGKACNMQGASK